jgi:hypothetical protein
MPQRDTMHNLVKQALSNSGWEITDDPYVISYGKHNLFVDLAAIPMPTHGSMGGGIIGAQKQDRRIAVEIKEFRGRSKMADLEQALGQYVLYRLLLNRTDVERELYLAISDADFDQVFRTPVGEVVVNDLPLKLIIIDSQRVEVKEWKLPIATS